MQTVYNAVRARSRGKVLQLKLLLHCIPLLYRCTKMCVLKAVTLSVSSLEGNTCSVVVVVPVVVMYLVQTYLAGDFACCSVFGVSVFVCDVIQLCTDVSSDLGEIAKVES